MRKLTATFILASLVLLGCDPKETTPPKEQPKETRPAVAVDYGEQAERIVEKIKAIETEKDVTCWTSFRQLDQFIATKAYSEFATLAKIEAQKNLVLAIWADASGATNAEKISGNDLKTWVEKTNVVEEHEGLSEYAGKIGFRQYEEYRTTSEHYRVVMAVTTDAIHSKRALKPIDASGLDAMADIATNVSLAILSMSSDVATRDRSPFIEGIHVQKTYDALKKKHGLETPTRTKATLSPKEIQTKLFPITKALIDAKFLALKSFNAEDPRSPKVVKDTMDAINTVAPIPMDEGALVHLTKTVQSFARFAASGVEPMRNDNYLSDGRFESKDTPRRLYIDAVWMENVIQQTFPHLVMPNGDVKLRFEPNPGIVGAGEREPYDILLLDHQQNAVRDSAIHWQILDGEFANRGFALDPFAAEMLSEVLSIMFTHFMYRAAENAKANGRDRITVEDAKRARDARFVQVLPVSEKRVQWSAENQKAKDELLATLPKSLFADATKKSNIGGLGEVKGDVNTFGIQTVMGSGTAVGDLDGDGDIDAFLAGIGTHRLLLNNGQGEFENATEKWGVEAVDDGKGALFFDANGDGKLDLLVVRARQPSQLYLQGNQTFEKPVTIATTLGAHVPAVFDYDGDGDLDLYVGYYGSDSHNVGDPNARNLPSMDGRNGTPNQLFKNENGSFKQNVAATARVDDTGWALAASSWDYDGDGDFDLYVANDFGRNAFLENQGDGTFKDVTDKTKTGDRGSGMNVSLADWNRDGLADFYVSNIDMFSKSIKVIFPTDDTTIKVDDQLQKAFQYIAGNKFYLSEKSKDVVTFSSQETLVFEPADRGWGWSANFFDYENDGDIDMYLSNGWIDGSLASNQKNQMYLANDGSYLLGPEGSAERFEGNSRSVASADFDGDGDEDLLVNNFNQAPRYFENTQAAKNGWVKIRLVGKKPNTQAVGARVTVTTGSVKQNFWMTGGENYLSQRAEFHVGIGNRKEATVEITWPDGKTSKHQVNAGAMLSATQK